MFLISVALVGVWIYVVMKNYLMTYRTRVFMAALVYIKALNILWEEEDKSFIKRTEKTHGWDSRYAQKEYDQDPAAKTKTTEVAVDLAVSIPDK